MSDPTPHLPAPSFDFLVWSSRLQTESHLGLTPWSQEKPEVNLPLARHSIDLLAMLQDKTRNNLSMEEQRLLDNTLTELRFRYIQSFENEQKRKVEDSAATAGPTFARQRSLGSGTRSRRTMPDSPGRLTITVLGSGTSVGVPTIGCPCEVCHSVDPRDQRLRPSIALRWNEPLRCRRHWARFPAAGSPRRSPARGRGALYTRSRRPHPGPRRSASLQLPPKRSHPGLRL